jgi:hypothetical protein
MDFRRGSTPTTLGGVETNQGIPGVGIPLLSLSSETRAVVTNMLVAFLSRIFPFFASSCTSLPAPSGEKQKLLAETYSVFNESGRNFFFGTEDLNESGRNYICWDLAY